LNTQRLIRAFKAGESVLSLSRRTEHTRYAITGALIDAGVLTRKRRKKPDSRGRYRCSGCGKWFLPKDMPRFRYSEYQCSGCVLDKQQNRKDLPDYAALVERYGNRCAICGCKAGHTSKRGIKARFAVDHSHRTGRIRGLLCGRCNRGLGFFGDSVKNLQSAIRYLKNSRG